MLVGSRPVPSSHCSSLLLARRCMSLINRCCEGEYVECSLLKGYLSRNLAPLSADFCKNSAGCAGSTLLCLKSLTLVFASTQPHNLPEPTWNWGQGFLMFSHSDITPQQHLEGDLKWGSVGYASLSSCTTSWCSVIYKGLKSAGQNSFFFLPWRYQKCKCQSVNICQRFPRSVIFCRSPDSDSCSVHAAPQVPVIRKSVFSN